MVTHKLKEIHQVIGLQLQCVCLVCVMNIKYRVWNLSKQIAALGAKVGITILTKVKTLRDVTGNVFVVVGTSKQAFNPLLVPYCKDGVFGRERGPVKFSLVKFFIRSIPKFG